MPHAQLMPARRRVRRAGAGDAGADLLATAQAQSAWADVKGQLVSEGASDFDIAAVQGTFGNALTQLASQGIQSGLADTDILNAAKQYVLMGSTVWGSVQNVGGLLAHANSVPPAALITSFTGTLVGAVVAAGALTAGVGAAIVGAVSSLLALLQNAGFFGSPPQGAEICPGFYCQGAVFTVVTQGPSGSLGCCCVSQAADSPAMLAPGSPAWRNFPDKSQPEDAVWLTEESGGAIGQWRGAVFGVPASFNGLSARPIDRAFPQYRTLESNTIFHGSPFQQAFFAAWKMNAAYALNGLKPQDDAQVLLHTLRLWNRAHDASNMTKMSPSTGALLNATDPMSATASNYISLLVSAAAAIAGSDPTVVDGSGNLILNLGPMKSAPSPCGPDQMVNPAWLVQQSMGGSPNVPKCIQAPWAKQQGSTLGSVALGTATAVGVAAGGLAVYAHVTRQSYTGLFKSLWGASLGRLL